ncbi:uncharacterized protein P884DRAFT_230763 [Thermothelomyces heterothallicus CBS 202.75]|uniref:uncharacterized protein n=1 Tax=Thermothelomyces heterothallicus CBS 202.75 TaxID=1149848 RepID=UPI003743B325
MTESNSGVQATPAADMLCQANPITAECFLPPRFSCPRAWQRVAVAPVPGMRRQSRIWKRVGGLAVGTGQSPYIRAMAELERQGMGPRKRARHAHHLQAWGDAKWDSRAEERPDGHQDIVEAQGMVSDAAHKPTTMTTNTKTKLATYPEESLKWVPRKRHNSRWPLAPKSEARSPTTHLQHSTESERPVSTEATAKVDEEQMSKRSTCRLSRRISLLPGDESPRRLSTVALSPAGSAAPAALPVKRSSVALSPTKVADSPLRSFRVNATPTKVVLESPKFSPPEKSPAKLQAPLIPDTRPSSPPASSPASPAPLMFDQPVPDAQAEPEHEIRRRLSLQSARRSERGSNGALRLLALKRGTDNLNRRHSLTAIPAIPVGDGVRGESKSRRKTMGVFSAGLETTGGNAEDARTTGAIPDHRRAKDVVEIDMKTRLDIFGQSPVTAEANPPLLSSDGQSPLTSGGLGVAKKVEVEAEAEQATPRCQAAITSVAAETNEASAFTQETSPRLAESASVEGGSESDAVRLSGANEPPCAAHEVTSDEGGQAPNDDLQEATQNLAPATNPHACVEMEHLSEQEMIEAQFTNGGSPVANVEQSKSTTNADSSASSPASPRLRSDTPNLEAEATEAVQDEEPVVAASVTGSHVSSGSVASAANGTAVGTELPQHNTENTATDDLDENARATDDQAANPPKDCGVNPCPTGITTAQLPESSSGTDRSTPPSPGTPCSSPIASSKELMEGVANPQNQGDGLSPSRESSGFTPINKRRVPPPSDLPTGLHDDEEPAADHESDELDADEVVEEDVPQEEGDEDIVAMDEDMTVEAPKPECDTLQLHARQDDSETEMLRNFVTRVAAGKSAKAAAAAAALAKKIARRSSSLGSISSTGSPVGRAGSETPGSRQPLGVRSPNSASPAKKRKADAFEDDLAKEDSSADPCAEPTDGPRLKKHRKYPESILKTAPETAAPSSEANSALPSNITTSLLSPKPGPRRSTRARSMRVALKPSAPSANSIAFSMIPVRLPGMGAMDEPAMASDAHLSAARQRSEEKDLAAVTRANTRKNKGGAVPPPVVLAKQAEDPAGWRMRELKGVWEAKERRKGAALSEKDPEAEEEDGGKGKKGKKVKEVRWAEELVRYQPYEEGGGMFSGMARALLADVMADDGVDEIAEAEPPVPAEPAVEKTARVAARKAGSGRKSSTTGEGAPAPPAAPASTRRTRSSRLPPPTPVKKLRSAGKPAAEKSPSAEKTEPAEKPAATSSLRTRARSLPKRAAAPAPATAPATVDPSPATASSSTRTGMATRRTRVTKLGMSGNGTPAPKRRGKAAA